jgi:integrase
MARRRRRRGAGEVLRAGAGWAVRWREGGRRRYRAGFTSREDAERVLDHIRGEIALGRCGVPPPAADVPTLGELAPDWLDRRDHTHRAARFDRSRWKLHLEPFFGRMHPGDVGVAEVEKFVTGRLATGLAPATVGVCVHILEALFSDLMTRRPVPLATSNPCHQLSKETRRLVKGTTNPEAVPFIEKMEDVRRIFLALNEPVNVAYALGALAGLRTGEIVGLRWEAVDLAGRTITVRVQEDDSTGVERCTKSGKARRVPVLDGLLPVLTAWKLKTGGKGLLVPKSRKVLRHALQVALTSLGLARDGLGWYQATRHTFASQWLMADRSMEKVSKILGHSSIAVTEKHYAHLRQDLFSERDRATLALDLRPSAATVGQLSASPGEAGSRNAQSLS